MAPILHSATGPELTAAQLYQLLRLRTEVFIVEQECAYQELDGRDLARDTRHWWLAAPAAPDEPLAYLRVLTEPAGGYRIGRVVTASAARGDGLAGRLFGAALADLGDVDCVLDARTYVQHFYAGYGFTPVGAEFLEDGLEHIRMRRAAPVR
ncbi:ElaA protein [Tamaricihabitans halophyticus]|uniref:ElaA protein n=1 Tax=Tamaricihabitans halophyticus TaxID=1262583 RepID=A0A4R2QIF1_9PSEU|nr:GNAT family N-acetyltransferase [Tamaricihabitans halophyticus]TCP46725.1 ElaA protein [Tamaricihabitans halophyticus]